MELTVSRISPRDRAGMEQLGALLQRQGIARDGNLDYTLGLYDDDRLVATGSYYQNTLRCLAVDSDYQGEGLLNRVVSELSGLLAGREVFHLFVYTKCRNAPLFRDLGYHEICRVGERLSFLENRSDGFEQYLSALQRESERPDGTAAGRTAAIVMNANPFTNGHRYLVETAAAACDTLHLFVVTQQASPIPFAVRYELVRSGVAHLDNVVLHQTGSYLISGATFPSYFLRDSEDVICTQAELDVALFCKIAQRLGITARFVGEEPTSLVTAIYNQVMQPQLAADGIALTVLERLRQDDAPISASTVRKLLQQGKLDEIQPLVPPTTYDFFRSTQGAPIIQALQAMGDVVHY